MFYNVKIQLLSTMQLRIVTHTKGEPPITAHLRDYAPDITIFGNRRLFHDFETVEGRSFSNKEQEKHKNIFNVT